MNSNLCEACKPLISSRPVFLPIHTTGQKLKTAKNVGCDLCQLIYKGLEAVVRGGIQNDGNIIICPGKFGRPMDVLYGGTQNSESIALQFFSREGASTQRIQESKVHTLFKLEKGAVFSVHFNRFENPTSSVLMP